MRKKIILDENRWLAETIAEQYETIASHTGRIPTIELDLLMENVRKFYENLRVLQRLEDHPLSPPVVPQPAAAEHDHTIKFEEAPSQPAPAPIPTPQPAHSPPPPPAVLIQLEHEPARHEENPAEIGSTATQRPLQPTMSKRPPKPPEIDLFAQEEQPMQSKLQDARDRAFAPKIPGPRIENLKMAIPINDKFLFINDLFDGNLREYNETIEALNGFKTMDQAADYLDLMCRKNFWKTESGAFLKLKDLVERRFQ